MCPVNSLVVLLNSHVWTLYYYEHSKFTYSSQAFEFTQDEYSAWIQAPCNYGRKIIGI